MVKRPLFCEACGCVTDHLIQDADDEGEILAMCTHCGRLQTLSRSDDSPRSPPAHASLSVDPRTR